VKPTLKLLWDELYEEWKTVLRNEFEHEKLCQLINKNNKNLCACKLSTQEIKKWFSDTAKKGNLKRKNNQISSREDSQGTCQYFYPRFFRLALQHNLKARWPRPTT
jgi:hypothetical protein